MAKLRRSNQIGIDEEQRMEGQCSGFCLPLDQILWDAVTNNLVAMKGRGDNKRRSSGSVIRLESTMKGGKHGVIGIDEHRLREDE